MYSRVTDANDWWFSHTMAPTAILFGDDIIRVYLGAWDKFGISRIGWIDVMSSNPTQVVNKSTAPILDIGDPGTFDENGVFPGHISQFNNRYYLHYTGFQLGQKISHYNFGGLAISDDGINFTRVSKAPILDRSDEGLSVRAGASSILMGDKYATAYSAGSDWVMTGGKLRPCYDVFLQESSDLISLKKFGERVVQHNPLVEHGLGRPQIVQIKNNLFLFYTRRILGMKYFFGYAAFDSSTLKWIRKDDQINISHSKNGAFDSEMIYFPSVVSVPNLNKVYLFYSGNGFGKDGLGVLEMIDD